MPAAAPRGRRAQPCDASRCSSSVLSYLLFSATMCSRVWLACRDAQGAPGATKVGGNFRARPRGRHNKTRQAGGRWSQQGNLLHSSLRQTFAIIRAKHTAMYTQRPEDLHARPVSGVAPTESERAARIKEVFDPVAMDSTLAGKTIAEGRPVVTATAVPATGGTAATPNYSSEPSHLTSQQAHNQHVPAATTTTTTTTVKQQPSAAEQVPSAPVVRLAEEQLPGRRRVWLAKLAQRDYKETLTTWRERIGRWTRSNAGRSWLPAALALLTALMLGSLLVRS